MEAAKAFRKIKEQISVPLVADVHFDHRLAIAAVENGADKLRINPGNITEIQNAILSFIHNRDKIEKYGRQSLKLINVFLPETVFRTLCNLYKQLL